MNHFNSIRQYLDLTPKSNVEDITYLKEYKRVRIQLGRIYEEKCKNKKIYTNECKIVYDLLFGLHDK